MTMLRDTTGAEVVRRLAAERRSDGVASGLALNLVVAYDEPRAPVVEEAVTTAAATHPFRLLLVTRPAGHDLDQPDQLDAEIVISGRLGACEAVIMRMQGRLALHADSVVRPLLASEVPVATWWHGPPPERISTDPLGVIASRRITETTQAEDPIAALHQRAVDYAAGDTDLAWTRVTGWRALLASTLDSESGTVTGGTVTAPSGHPGAALLAGWLRTRFEAPIRIVEPATGGLNGVRLDLSDGRSISISRHDGSGLVEHTGREPRMMPLLTPSLGDLVAEELRRLGSDAIYAEALSAATGVPDLTTRPATRTHTWVEPAQELR